MRRFAVALASVCVLIGLSTEAKAHFQMLLPSTDIVSSPAEAALTLTALFTHPMESHLMHMARPKRLGVCVKGGRPVSLLDALKETKVGDHSTWTAPYTVKRPGDHVFFVEPAPYWEPAEQKFIIHYTKVVVNAMGLEEGWDEPLGLPVEIIPLVRPYGLWTGNQFRGIVMRAGKPVPFAEIEVEYYNAPGKPAVKAPADPFVTQVIKADANGVFSYTMPRAGWWGFAALVDGDTQLKGPDGKDKDVELGGLMWVRTVDMK